MILVASKILSISQSLSSYFTVNIIGHLYLIMINYRLLKDPYQMSNLAVGRKELPVLRQMRSRLKDFLAAAHDDFLPSTAYGDWYDEERNLIRTGLGPISSQSIFNSKLRLDKTSLKNYNPVLILSKKIKKSLLFTQSRGVLYAF